MIARNLCITAAVLALATACADATDPRTPKTQSVATVVSARIRQSSSGGSNPATMSKTGNATVTLASYGIVPAANLGGAIAQVVRDPTSEYPELVILADEQLTERLYVVARSLLTRDKLEVPVASGRRVISLMPDLLMRLDADGHTKWRRSDMVLGNITNTVIPEMRRRQHGARDFHVEGVGHVKLVFDYKNPHP